MQCFSPGNYRKIVALSQPIGPIRGSKQMAATIRNFTNYDFLVVKVYVNMKERIEGKRCF